MKNTAFPRLLSPGSIAGIPVRNRIVMPAMGTNMADGGFVNDAILNHYAERAKGGVGLIIVEVTCVDTPLGLNTSRMLVIDDDKYITGFRRLTDAIHAHGAKCMLQISHTGRGAKSKIIGTQPVGPSEAKKPFDFLVGFEGETPRALSIQEIQRIEDKYAEAALRAKQAGFDGVEVHATGYYLVAQFFSKTANLRTDEYGGSARKRARFALNIIRKIQEKAGKDFPIIFKLSVLEIGQYGGVSILDGLLNCRLLEQAGVGGIEVLAGAWSTRPGRFDRPDSGQAKGLTFPILRIMRLAGIRLPLIGGGRTFEPHLAERALRHGWADFIFMGRGLLTQPNLPCMIADGTWQAARPCIGCGECIDGQLQRDERITCSGNPVIGNGGNDYAIPLAQHPKKVFVIGGGPAGVEAARIAAMRGHTVTLFEKSERVGGQIYLAVVPPYKGNLELLLAYMERQLILTGVKVVLKTEMIAEQIIAQRPDVVVCATGLTPARPPIPGIDRPMVMDVTQALAGTPVGKRVVIIGGGEAGCETAQWLVEKGKKVIIVEMLDELAAKMVATSRTILLAHLQRLRVKIYTSHRCLEIKDGSVIIADAKGLTEEIRADTVLVATGARKNDALYTRLLGKVPELYAVGDCLGPANVRQAVSTGYYTGLKV
ncbi:MAG TPA: FAD-dependent oxidoreductase [Anaerolineales bacterium]